MLSAKRSARAAKADANQDPVVLAFLRFLEVQMAAQPVQVMPADAAQLARICKLVRGVKAA